MPQPNNGIHTLQIDRPTGVLVRGGVYFNYILHNWRYWELAPVLSLLPLVEGGVLFN